MSGSLWRASRRVPSFSGTPRPICNNFLRLLYFEPAWSNDLGVASQPFKSHFGDINLVVIELASGEGEVSTR
jgi:hypothetical protein